MICKNLREMDWDLKGIFVQTMLYCCSFAAVAEIVIIIGFLLIILFAKI